MKDPLEIFKQEATEIQQAYEGVINALIASKVISKTKVMKIMGKVITIIVLFFLIPSCNIMKKEFANQDSQAIDSLVSFCYNNDIFNGTILVAKNDKVIYKNALGYTNYDLKTKLTINSVFSIASVSKTFTSTAILKLQEQGKLNLNDKLSKYFPDFPNAENITIRHLLFHTSGMQNYLVYGGVFRVKDRPGDFIDGVTNVKAFNYLKTIDTLRFQPRERFEYSNSGYLMLSLIVEKASGKAFHQFIKDEIYTPLKMNNSYVISEPNIDIPNRVSGFTNFYTPDDDNLLTTGGGGILTTVEDLYKWHKGLSLAKNISKETQKKAFVNITLNDGSLSHNETDTTWCYGMGWVFRMNEKDSIAFHDGGLNACSAMFYQDLGQDFTIIILSNKGSTNANHAIYTIRDEIIHILKGEQYNFPKVPISLKMYQLLNNFSLRKAVEKCMLLQENKKNKFDFSANQLNRLGYHYLQNKEYVKAKAVFELNIEFYPENANVYDSYAEALMINSENEKAIKYYRKSLRLNPNNENAKNMVQQILKITNN